MSQNKHLNSFGDVIKVFIGDVILRKQEQSYDISTILKFSFTTWKEYRGIFGCLFCLFLNS